MRREEITALLGDFETRHDVLSFRPFGWHAWPALRVTVGLRAHGAPTSAKSAAPRGERRKDTGNLRLRGDEARARLSGWSRPLRGASVCPVPAGDVVLLTHANRAQKLGDRWVNPLVDPLADALRARGATPAVWTLKDGRKASAETERDLSQWLAQESERLAGDVPPSSVPEPSWGSEFSALVQEMQAWNLSWKEAAKLLARVEVHARVLERWLRAVDARLVLVDSWYSMRGLATCLAASRAGIPTVDIQHGLQGDGHFAYAGWQVEPPRGFEIVPDAFWLWGERDRTIRAESSPVLAQRRLLLVGGSPWLDAWRFRRSGPMSAVVREAENRAKGHTRTIVVTLQKGIGFIDDLRSLFQGAPPGILWWIRAHRNMMNELGQIEHEIRGIAGDAPVDVRFASESLLYALLEVADLHVTWFSTCAAEALAFGVPTLLLHASGEHAYREELADGVMARASGRDAPAALQALEEIPPERCRAAAERHFAMPPRGDRAVEGLLSIRLAGAGAERPGSSAEAARRLVELAEALDAGEHTVPAAAMPAPLEAAKTTGQGAVRWPQDLVGRPSPAPPAAHHASAFREALKAQSNARAAYHARWLAHLLDPFDPDTLPRVCVVIPLYNAARLVPEAVRSCLAQTYPRVEVVVVDDGSRDHPESELEGLGERVTLIQKENGGCGSARNAGVAVTHAEFVHFLDADDLLEPDAVARKIEAFRCIPDAELCCSSYRSTGEDGHRGAHVHRPPPLGDEDCPTHDLLHTAARRWPFSTITVMAPRWVLLRTGPWDEDMRNGSDARYWFRLALHDTKVVALRRELSVRRFRPGSLTSTPFHHQRGWAVNHLLGLEELLARPSRWIYVPSWCKKLRNRIRWRVLNEGTDPQLDVLRERVFESIAGLNRRGREEGRSARPVLAGIEHHLELGARKPVEDDRFRTEMRRQLRSALQESADPTPQDVGIWLSGEGESRAAANAPARDVVLRWLDSGIRAGRPAVGLDELRRLAKRWPEHDVSRDWRIAIRLAPVVGLSSACRLAERAPRDLLRRLRGRARMRSRLRARPAGVRSKHPG